MMRDGVARGIRAGGAFGLYEPAMNIAYVFDRPLPARETDSEQAVRTLSALARRGAHLTLVLPSTANASPRARDIAEHYGVDDNFSVLGIPNPFQRWASARKGWHARRALQHPRVRAADVIYTRNFPTLFALASGRRAFAYETYRPWPRQFPILKPAFRNAMRSPYFLGAILHSHFACKSYGELGVEAQRMLVAHNGHDPSAFTDSTSRETLRQQLGLPVEGPLVVYAGHVNATKGLHGVVGMARAHPRVQFALVGSDGYGWIESLASQRANLHVVRWQPFAQVARYLRAADVLLQPPSSVPLRLVGNTVLPMKLFSYLAAGRPIVAPDLPDVRELLRHDENAWLVRANDWLAAGRAIVRLVGDAALAERLSAAALETSRELTWDARAKRVLDFLENRLSAHQREAS